MISVRRRWAAAALVVGLGWLVTPGAVPVYDGVGQPDEPYRYVAPPAGATPTTSATSALARSPVRDGVTSSGLTVASEEVGPQVELFIPLGGLAAAGPDVRAQAVPAAPTDQPPGATIDGNVYVVTLTDGAGPVRFTPKSALAVIYLRATTAEQPPPVTFRRSGHGQPWVALKTSRGGTDIYVASLSAPGEYALAFLTVAGTGGGVPVLPIALAVGIAALVGVVLVVRLRARSA